jgi:hypothetical protein
MGLGSQLFEGQLRMLLRIALGTESGITQAGATVLEAGLAVPPTKLATTSRSSTGTGIATIAAVSTVAGTTGVTRPLPSARHHGLRLFHTRPIIATHRHQFSSGRLGFDRRIASCSIL